MILVNACDKYGDNPHEFMLNPSKIVMISSSPTKEGFSIIIMEGGSPIHVDSNFDHLKEFLNAQAPVIKLRAIGLETKEI